MNETERPSDRFRSLTEDEGSAGDNRPFPLLRPNPKDALPPSLLVIAGALAFWLLTRERTPGSLSPLALVGCGALVLAGLAWMIRRGLHQGIFLSGQLLLIVLETTADVRRAPFPLGAAPVLAALLMLFGLFGMERKADELERRVLKGGLAVAAMLGAGAMVAWSITESLGAPRAPAMAWFGVLILGLYAGLVIVARRYS